MSIKSIFLFNEFYGKGLDSHVAESECLLTRLSKIRKAEFTAVIEHFRIENNADSGHYGQTLITIAQGIILMP